MRIAPKNISLLICTILLSNVVNAQQDNNPPPPPLGPVGPGYPINENLAALAVAGIILAIYFFKSKKATVK